MQLGIFNHSIGPALHDTLHFRPSLKHFYSSILCHNAMIQQRVVRQILSTATLCFIGSVDAEEDGLVPDRVQLSCHELC